MTKEHAALYKELIEAAEHRGPWRWRPSPTLFREAAKVIEELSGALNTLAVEYHRAINEPMYSGTREDWKARAKMAEHRVDELKRVLG